jgi:sortase A
MIESQVEGTTPAPPADTVARASAARPVLSPRARWTRRVGNLLIGLGLVLMVGVGGYLAYQTYTNNQIEQQIAQQHADAGNLTWLPPAAAPDAGTPVAPGANEAAPANAAAPIPTPANNTVRVDDSPLARLNTPKLGASLIAQRPVLPATKITIPTVGIDTSVVEVGWDMLPGKDGQQSAQWQVAAYAAGHNEGSANPGQVGNMVISGHVDWKGEVFKNLHEVKRGDEVHIFTNEREFLYIVQDIVLVKEDGVSDAQKRENARYMDPTPDQTLTLITCFPYGIDDHRLIVIAKPYDSSLAARPDLIIK